MKQLILIPHTHFASTPLPKQREYLFTSLLFYEIGVSEPFGFHFPLKETIQMKKTCSELIKVSREFKMKTSDIL